MPEWGMLPMPKKLLRQGVRDMVRLSDARMSGTSYGTCVLHVAPASAAGGPLALVRTGDMIELDVPARRIHLDVPDDELARRRAEWTPSAPGFGRGYTRLYIERVTQAAFGQRRKMLRQSLRALGADVPALLGAAGLDPTARAEDISVEGFTALARALAEQRAGVA